MANSAIIAVEAKPGQCNYINIHELRDNVLNDGGQNRSNGNSITVFSGIRDLPKRMIMYPQASWPLIRRYGRCTGCEVQYCGARCN